jgi:hypothetical protein
MSIQTQQDYRLVNVKGGTMLDVSEYDNKSIIGK